MIGNQAPAVAPASVRPLSPAEFLHFQRLICDASGIFLPESKLALLSARVGRRVRELGFRDFPGYRRHVIERGEEEMAQLLDCVCTNETHFFREPKQFEFLEQRVFPARMEAAREGRGPKRIRVWSAGCATGEEAYSIAMTMAASLPPDWERTILATDLSTRALAVARQAEWRIEKASEIPRQYRERFMLRGVRRAEGRMRARDEIRSMIELARVNLSRDERLFGGPFDLIFCRNVLIYFSREARAAAIDRLLRHLAPGGLLFLGHAESLAAGAHAVRAVGPTAYMRAGEAELA
ncbi:MAG TPA: protein-glutamate O-methyltransferase CheR [Thermoanaerobaculia bacterium]|nr:protein-glutamate O-methyltransferase CheR [Thermoanaerobaculia bacterium]